MKKSIAVITTVFVLTASGLVMAQMNDQSQGMMKDNAMGDGMMKDEANVPVAISGYCPYCVLSGIKMKGSDHFVTEYKGKIYKFSTFEMQRAFLDNPEQYTKDLDAKFAAMSK